MILFNNRELVVTFPFSAAEYAKVPLVPPYLQPGFNYYAHGVNFASAGAGALAQSYQGYVCHPLVYIRISLTKKKEYMFYVLIIYSGYNNSISACL